MELPTIKLTKKQKAWLYIVGPFIPLLLLGIFFAPEFMLFLLFMCALVTFVGCVGGAICCSVERGISMLGEKEND